MKLYPATEGHAGPVTHQYHRDDLGRIRYLKFCEAEDHELSNDEIDRGAERDGAMVVLTDQDMESLLPTKQSGVRAGSTRLWHRSDTADQQVRRPCSRRSSAA